MRIVDISPAVDELYVLEVSTLLWGELIGLAVIGVGGSNVCEKPDGSKKRNQLIALFAAVS